MENIEALISKENQYFEPMLARYAKATMQEREKWRKETIRDRQERISIEVFDLLGGVVKYGPFKGLKLDEDTWWGKLDLGSQCLGLYEKELLNEIEAISEDKYQTFIDIGAADGYYAVGMLTSKKVRKTICFEQAQKGRDAILSKWDKNGSVGDLSIHGEASISTLSMLKKSEVKNSITLIDIEGGEFDLLNMETLKLLSSSIVFIEIHNWVDEFLKRYATLLREASTLFQIEIISPVERNTLGLDELRDFTDDNRLLLISERRPCRMRFLKLLPYNY
jgi:precorrin-6B methylase 2